MKTITGTSNGAVRQNKVISVSSMTRSGTTVTVDTLGPHYLDDGDMIYVRGADQADYNVDLVIASKVDEHRITFTVATTPVSPATGTITIEKAVKTTQFEKAATVNDEGEQLVKAGGHTALVSDEMARPSNTTAYAVGDLVGTDLAVTGATNASPIVITAASHGLETGDRVTVAGVGGNTAANADWEVRVISANTFELKGSTGNGAYTSGGLVHRPFTFQNVSRLAGDEGYVLNVRLFTNNQVTTNGSFRLYLLREAPSMVADNAAWPMLWADRSKYLASVDLVLRAEAVPSDCAMGYNDAIRLAYKAQENYRSIYGVLVAQGAYVPAADQSFLIELTLEQN
jgi:hypothetical protein